MDPLSSRPSLPPAIPPSCRLSTLPADSRCGLQHNSFLCWPALYENLMVIAHRCHIRVRQWREGRESPLKRIFRGGKMEVVIVVSQKTERSYSGSSRRRLESLRRTLGPGTALSSSGRWRRVWRPVRATKTGRLKFLCDRHFAIHPDWLGLSPSEGDNGDLFDTECQKEFNRLNLPCSHQWCFIFLSD